MRWPMLCTLAALASVILVMQAKLLNAGLRNLARVLCGALIGWCWASMIANHALSLQLAPALEERELTVIGVVTSLPESADLGQRFQFRIERVVTPGVTLAQLPHKVLLGWYDATYPGSPAVRTAVDSGERWQLKLRLRRPHGLANPFGFDYEAWLLEQNIGATGSVRPDKDGQINNVRLTKFVFSANNLIEHLRGRLRERIMRALPDQPFAAIIVALVIGDQNAITQNDWTVVARTGVSHLFAISGLHISMVAGMAAAGTLYLWRLAVFSRFALPLILPAQKAAALAGVVVALIYVSLAGFGVPAQRTLIMICVVAMSLCLNRQLSVSLVLMAALGLVLLVDPWALLWPGFWLSFSAVGLIFYASQGRSASPDPGNCRSLKHQPVHNLVPQFRFRQGWLRIRRSAREASITQYAITLGLLPLTLLLFNQVSLISPVANALAIPAVSLLITPLALIGSLLPDPVGSGLLIATHQLLVYLFSFLRWLSEFGWAVWHAPRPDVWMALCAMWGALWCLAPKGWPMRWAGLLAWLPMCLNSSSYPGPAELRVTALDIGQGMALLVETARHRMLYDAGPAYSPSSDAGSRVIYPYLAARGIASLDGFMISHNDTDHSGGAISLMQQLQIGWVTSSLSLESAVVQVANQTSRHVRCLAGQKWEWDGVQFELLHPVESIYRSEKWKPNAKSCTLKITDGTHSILLAGDIEAAQEDELVHSIPEKLAATVLLVPHHGSGTSSTLEFLQAVHPRLGVFQFGYHNRYNHPKPTVWQRYADLDITRLRNDSAGAITLNFSDTLKVDSYRRSHARYWYADVAEEFK